MKIKNRNLSFFVLTCLLILSVSNAQAQLPVKSAGKTVATNVIKGTLDLKGTWDYEGSSIEFQSSNLIKKAGAKVAQATLQSSVDSQLENLGFVAGYTTFVFNADGTFSNTTKDKTIKGKYTYDKKNNLLTLKYMGKIPMKLHLKGSGDTMSMMFQADQFLSFASIVGGVIDSSLGSLFSSYDGLMIGLKFNKQ